MSRVRLQELQCTRLFKMTETTLKSRLSQCGDLRRAPVKPQPGSSTRRLQVNIIQKITDVPIYKKNVFVGQIITVPMVTSI